MKRRASSSQPVREHPPTGKSRDSQHWPAQGKTRTSPVQRMLRDVLNLGPMRDAGDCWPVLVPRKK